MSWTPGVRVKVTNTGQSYTTHTDRVALGCVESKFTLDLAPSNGDTGFIVQYNSGHNSCAIEINGRHFLVGCSGLQVLGGVDPNYQSGSSSSSSSSSGSSKSNGVEWNTHGFWEKTEGASGGSAVRFFITKTNLADAPYIHIKRIHLKDLNDNPVLFTAHCTRKLKKSRHQTDAQAQDMVEGKYRPARLAEPPPTTRTKWAAVAPRGENDAAILELRPVGSTHFPVLSGFSFDNGIRTSRYPATWRFQSLQGSTWKTLQTIDDCPGSFCESFIALPPQAGVAFRALPPLFEAIAAQDEATCLKALHNAGGSTWDLGNLTNLEEVLLAVVATKNLRLLSLFSLLGPLPSAVVKAALLSGQQDIIRFVCRSQGVSRSLFKHALAARSLETFDFLATLGKRILRDEETYIVSSAGSSREVLAYVVARYAQLKEEKEEEIPDYPALRNPNAKILRSALLGGDLPLFLQLAGRTDAEVLGSFLESAVVKKLPLTTDILQALLDAGIALGRLFDGVVDNDRIDLAQFFLANGLASPSGLDGALWRALLAGKEEVIDLLINFGASCPAGPLFARLLNEEGLTFATASKALSILKRHSLFDPSAVSAETGVSLIEQAIAKDPKHPLVAALLQNGAPALLPSGESVFKLLAEKLTDKDELLALLSMCGPSETAAASTALLRFVGLHTDSLPEIDDLRKFKEAGADFNITVEDQSVLAVIVRSKQFTRAIFDAVVAFGADPASGPELAGIALCNDAVPEEDYQYLASLRPRDPIELLWTLVIETPLYKKSTTRATGVFEQLIATEGLNLTVTRSMPLTATSKSTTGCNHKLFSLLFRNVSEKKCQSCSTPVGGTVRCWWCPVLSCETAYYCNACTEDHQSHEIPLITAACILQTKPNAFLALYDKGARQPAEFSNPQKEVLLWLCSVIRLSGNASRVSIDSSEDVDKFIDCISEPPVLPPAKLLVLYLETMRKSVRIQKAAEINALFDREDFDPNFEPTPFYPNPLISALKRHQGPELIQKLIEKGASVPQIETDLQDSLLGYVVHFYGSKAPSRKMSQIFQLILDAGADYKRRFVLAAAPHRGLPASHFLCVRSGKESFKSDFKTCVKALLAKGMDVNAKMTHPDLSGDTSSFWEFVRATPMDCNYAGNENLQRFFRKRDGVREYSNRANPL